MTDEELEIVKLIEQAAHNFHLENKLVMTTEFDNYQRYPAQFHLLRIVKPKTYKRYGYFFNMIGLYVENEEDYEWQVRFVRQKDDENKQHYFIRNFDCYDLYRLVSISPYLRNEKQEEDILIYVREILEKMYQFEDRRTYNINNETEKEKETCFIQ